MKVLSRHLFLRALLPFIFCLIAFSSLLLVIDLFTSLGDFVHNKTPIPWIEEYYEAFLPLVLIYILPIAILFSSLYTLLQLSRHAELVAMQASGISLWRIYTPFIVLGLLCTGALYCVTLGPGGGAKARREAVIARIRGDRDAENQKHGQVYEDRASGRVWYAQTLDLRHLNAQGLQILQADADHHDQKNYYATRGEFSNGSWTLYSGKILNFSLNGDLASEETFESLPCPTWTEPPLDMVALQIKADQMNLKQLKSVTKHLDFQGEAVLAPYRTQLLYLYTYPLSALVLTLFALADGTTHYRRNPAVGVFNAIFIVIAYFLILHTCLAMGRGDRIPPLYAVSLPLVLFACVGVLRLGPHFGWRFMDSRARAA